MLKNIQKFRNKLSNKVKDFKSRLDKVGIKYNDEFAYVEVSNPATGGSQHFYFKWLTSTTNSHPEQVKEAEKILEVLEA